MACTLVVFLPPGTHKEEDPGEAKDEVADELPGPVACEVLQSELEVDAPQGHGGEQEDASLNEEGLEGAVPDEGDNEEETANGEEQQAAKDSDVCISSWSCGVDPCSRCAVSRPWPKADISLR